MKIRILLSVAAITTILSFTACSSSKKNETAQLENQIAQLEQQVADLQNESQDNAQEASENSALDNPSVSPTENTSVQQDTPGEDTQQQKSAANTPNASALSSLIQDLEQRIQDTTPAGNTQEQREQFNALKAEIDALDRELDYLEDDLEAQYRAGSLQRSEYQEQKRESDALEDQLDRCEDQLEFLFGMDD